MGRRAVEYYKIRCALGKGQAAAVKFHQAFHSRECGCWLVLMGPGLLIGRIRFFLLHRHGVLASDATTKPSKGIEKLTGLSPLRIGFLDKCVSELRMTGVSSFFDLFVGADAS